MDPSTAPATDDALTVDCPDCQNGLSIELAARVEFTEHDPDGILDATCGRCGEEFAVGFRRLSG